MIAKKHDLKVMYENHADMQELGIQLFCGSREYPDTIPVQNYNFMHYLTYPEPLQKNIHTDRGDFQCKDSSTQIYTYLREETQKAQIQHMNPFRARYNTNNDCFLYVRVTDAAIYALAIEYYFKSLQTIPFDHLYIYSDDPKHPFIEVLRKIYPNNTVLHDFDEKRALQFGSTNKHVVLAHDCLSALIGYLSYSSDVYYPKYERMCFGVMFCIPGFRMIDMQIPSYTTYNNGRLCNQVIRNICTSMIAKKHNLKVIYANQDVIQDMGIKLYSGSGNYSDIASVMEYNFFHYLTMPNSLQKNIDTNHGYFQTKEITNHIYNYLQEKEQRTHMIAMNPFKARYGANNDCFIHMRLDDVVQWNPGTEYYSKALNNIQFDHLYIGSDDFTHPFVAEICKMYPNTTLLHEYDEKRTIQFGSTNKHVILSHGSFSAIIGYLAYYSTVYYPKYEKMWHGDMYSIPGWNMVDKTQ